jgi:hypothetical protein
MPDISWSPEQVIMIDLLMDLWPHLFLGPITIISPLKKESPPIKSSNALEAVQP